MFKYVVGSERPNCSSHMKAFPQPKMRPSTAQLMQDRLLELEFRKYEIAKMYVHHNVCPPYLKHIVTRVSMVEAQEAMLTTRQCKILKREGDLAAQESHVAALLSEKDSEIACLQG